MGTTIDAVVLEGAHELAQALGGPRPQVVRRWRHPHPDFPKPIATLRTSPLWAGRKFSAGLEIQDAAPKLKIRNYPTALLSSSYAPIR